MAKKTAPKPKAVRGAKAGGRAKAGPSTTKSAKAGGMTFAEVMSALEGAGAEKTRAIYARQGAQAPMFGVAFGFLQQLRKRIGVDQALALRLWETGNFDARNLAFKIADPAALTPAELDRWARDTTARMLGVYVGAIAVEGPHAGAKSREWLASKDERLRRAGWLLTAAMAMRDPAIPDARFSELLGKIERGIHAAPAAEKDAMVHAIIAIGGRSAALHEAVLAATKRIGAIEIDAGTAGCRTPDPAEQLAKLWKWAAMGKFASPSAREQNQDSPRIRC